MNSIQAIYQNDGFYNPTEEVTNKFNKVISNITGDPSIYFDPNDGAIYCNVYIDNKTKVPVNKWRGAIDFAYTFRKIVNQ